MAVSTRLAAAINAGRDLEPGRVGSLVDLSFLKICLTDFSSARSSLFKFEQSLEFRSFVSLNWTY